MQKPQPFIRRETERPVTAGESMDIVRSGGNCHMLRVNPAHESPSLRVLESAINEFSFGPEDGDAFLMQESLRQALASAKTGKYGVGAVLTNTRSGAHEIIATAQNERIKGGEHEFTGHAEMRLVDTSTPYLQDQTADHAHDRVGVNLCPCPGCFGHMIDAHFPDVVIGSPDPRIGAAFLTGENLVVAAGEPRQQVIAQRGLKYRLPEIADAQTAELVALLSWDIFHATRKAVHRAVHGGTLKE